MSLIDIIEKQLNATAWHQLQVRRLFDGDTPTPPEFARVPSPAAFNILCNRATTMASAPLHFQAASLDYLRNLPASAIPGLDEKIEYAAPRLQMAAPSELPIRLFELPGPNNVEPTPDNISSALYNALPNRPGLSNFISDTLRLVLLTERYVGKVSSFALLSGQNWTPSPFSYAPHEDMGHSGVRLFASLLHDGLLLTPTAVTHSQRKVTREVYGEDERNTPVHASFNALGAGNTYLLPAGQLAAWRVLDDYNDLPNGPALPHAAAPSNVTGNQPMIVMSVRRPKWPGYKHV